MTVESHWRLELIEHRSWTGSRKWQWQLIYALGLNANGGPWMIADGGKENTRQNAEEAAHESWLRKTSAVLPGEPVSWTDTQPPQ